MPPAPPLLPSRGICWVPGEFCPLLGELVAQAWGHCQRHGNVDPRSKGDVCGEARDEAGETGSPSPPPGWVTTRGALKESRGVAVPASVSRGSPSDGRGRVTWSVLSPSHPRQPGASSLWPSSLSASGSLKLDGDGLGPTPGSPPRCTLPPPLPSCFRVPGALGSGSGLWGKRGCGHAPEGHLRCRDFGGRL